MKHHIRHLITAVAIAATVASCTSNGKLQQYIENSNTSLAGKEISPGLWCDGVTIDNDTVLITYSMPSISATEYELANWDAISRQYRDIFMQGIAYDKDSDPEGIKILTEADIYLKGVFKFANASIDVILTPKDLDKILNDNNTVPD